MLNITDVRVHPGDAAFLLDDEKSAILYDCGFAFTGAGVAENIKRVLGERPLDAILLTHSHYDHAAGVPYIKRAYPAATVIAGAYAARIFAKPTARALMRELDQKAAQGAGVECYEDLIDSLSVDRAVNDGDTVSVGELCFSVLSLPGHTKCSVGYYCASEDLLLSSETLGVFDGSDDVFPAFLVGAKMSLDAIDRVTQLMPSRMLLPHLGVIEGETVARYLRRARERTEEIMRTVCEMLKRNTDKEKIREWIESTFYRGEIRKSYPIDAMRLNVGIMIDRVALECMQNIDRRT